MTADLPPTGASDWDDCFAGVPLHPERSARENFGAALRHMPRWARGAMGVRALMTRPFGLVNEQPGSGHFLSRLPVIVDEPGHFATGLADRHLTFTLDLRQRPERIKLSKRIWFNHWAGRLYLAVVFVPHKLIVHRMLSGVARDVTPTSAETETCSD